MALIALRDVSLGFCGPLVLDRVNLTIEPGERVCLLGRNGTGKTTLLRLIQGEIEPQGGEIARQQGLVTAMLPQEVPRELGGTVFDEVARGLGSRAELPAMHQAVEAAISRMTLDGDAGVASLSAGLKRRVLLAKALACSPDVLLLDEPTNHLDVEAICRLEEFLLRYGGTVLFVTHDRSLLRKAATRLIELDRGRLTSWSCDYETYLRRKDAMLEAEARQRAEFDKKLAREEVWIRTGIQARRTRNEGRVRALEELRRIRGARRNQPGEARMEIQEAARSGRLVVEAREVSFGYSGKGTAPPIIRDFSTIIMRGDRVGLIGPNGSGKTTLLRLLVGQLTPQTGTIRQGTNLDVAYFDQLHAQLDDEKSVRDNVCDGAEAVEINGRRRHIIGYLEDFLFTADQAAGPVARLSGGERNRLLLARLLSKPSNVLVMDEPTNDLDIETLELLEELLVEYPGTLLLVSHDREFLNNVVTSTLALEGEGRVKEYAGGYDDWLRQRPTEPAADKAEPAKQRAKPATPPKQRPRRLTYAEQRELEALPERIEGLEAGLSELHGAMAAETFYRRPAGEIVKAKARLQELQQDLAVAYSRWETLEALVAAASDMSRNL
jgi:ABC transport system ATP-binding/permease protein